ncbi:MAG: aryl-sulfate sulfotransferase [Saprospiraceae bacterium]|nr:aryl-sulfate sulfotransferase [Candidatus Vicinibacter affinis]
MEQFEWKDSILIPSNARWNIVEIGWCPKCNIQRWWNHRKDPKSRLGGKILFDYTISDNTQCAHHDFCPLPNGNVLVIVYELKSAAESSAKGGPNASRYSEKLIELKPTGLSTAEIVWEWHLWDHLCQNTNPALSNYVSSLVNTPTC